MTDPRIASGYDVEASVVGPFEVAKPGNTVAGGTLDRGIVARTEDGRMVVIGEIWAACPGGGLSKIRIDAKAVAHQLVERLNANVELVEALKLAHSALGAHGDNNSCRDCSYAWNAIRAALKAEGDG